MLCIKCEDASLSVYGDLCVFVQLYQKLVDSDIDGVTVYKKEDIPDKYHYKGHNRVSPIVVLAEKGYALLRVIVIIREAILVVGEL